MISNPKALFGAEPLEDEVKNVEEVERAVDGLSDEEYVEFRHWFLERGWEERNRQIGGDSDTGKLDFLVREAEEGADCHRLHTRATQICGSLPEE